MTEQEKRNKNANLVIIASVTFIFMSVVAPQIIRDHKREVKAANARAAKTRIEADIQYEARRHKELMETEARRRESDVSIRRLQQGH